MGRAIFELIRDLFKQRWFQQLFYWVSIASFASGVIGVIFAPGVFTDTSEYAGEQAALALFNIGFWALMVFLMRRQLKKDQ